jgi:hypothetical protein
MEVSSPPEYARTIVPFPIMFLQLDGSPVIICRISIYFQGEAPHYGRCAETALRVPDSSRGSKNKKKLFRQIILNAWVLPG